MYITAHADYQKRYHGVSSISRTVCIDINNVYPTAYWWITSLLSFTKEQEFNSWLQFQYNNCIWVQSPWTEPTDSEIPSATFWELRGWFWTGRILLRIRRPLCMLRFSYLILLTFTVLNWTVASYLRFSDVKSADHLAKHTTTKWLKFESERPANTFLKWYQDFRWARWSHNGINRLGFYWKSG